MPTAVALPFFPIDKSQNRSYCFSHILENTTIQWDLDYIQTRNRSHTFEQYKYYILSNLYENLFSKRFEHIHFYEENHFSNFSLNTGKIGLLLNTGVSFQVSQNKEIEWLKQILREIRRIELFGFNEEEFAS